MSEIYRAQLTAATQRQRKFESKHEYTLEEFGLSKEWIQQELSPLFDYYELQK